MKLYPRGLEETGYGRILLEWWKDHKRAFSWRSATDVYAVFVAETLLQRTRAENVKPIFDIFLERFPDIYSLANAGPGDILEVISPLGLRRRASVINTAARVIVEKYRGKIPLSRGQLTAIPGIGDYTASAIIVFSGHGDEPLIDSNTARIISRIFSLGSNYDSIRRYAWIRQVYREMKGRCDPASFGYAMIDLSSEICKAKGPSCHFCPLKRACSFFISSV
jgi:A/G-specific adenine glycosylase